MLWLQSLGIFGRNGCITGPIFCALKDNRSTITSFEHGGCQVIHLWKCRSNDTVLKQRILAIKVLEEVASQMAIVAENSDTMQVKTITKTL